MPSLRALPWALVGAVTLYGVGLPVAYAGPYPIDPPPPPPSPQPIVLHADPTFATELRWLLTGAAGAAAVAVAVLLLILWRRTRAMSRSRSLVIP